MLKWQKVIGVCTPGGDPCFRCPNCGGDEHVCGIEHEYNYHHECKKCKTYLLYPCEHEISSVKFVTEDGKEFDATNCVVSITEYE